MTRHVTRMTIEDAEHYSPDWSFKHKAFAMNSPRFDQWIQDPLDPDESGPTSLPKLLFRSQASRQAVRAVKPKKSGVAATDAGRGANDPTGWHVGDAPYLSALHNEIRRRAPLLAPAKGTREWSNWDGITIGAGAYLGLPGALKKQEDFKRQWVLGYQKAINAAAERFDLPPELLAAVAFKEVGGKPDLANRFGEVIRSKEGRNISAPGMPNLIRRALNPPEDQTSYGPLEIQYRRAEEALGYENSDQSSETQNRILRSEIEDPVTNIFIAAKHISDLRDQAYGHLPAAGIGGPQIQTLGAMYNGGVNVSPANKDAHRYGRDLVARTQELRALAAEPALSPR